MRWLRFRDYLMLASGTLLTASSLSFVHVNPAGGAGPAPDTTQGTAALQRLTVNVGNFPATQLVQDRDNPARQPFAEDCTTSTFSSVGLASCSLGAVPAGKRFVIETVSGQFQVASGTKPISVDLQVCAAGITTDNFFPAVFQGNSAFFTGDFFTVDQLVRLYADNTPGCSAPLFSITISNATSGSIELVVSGYLVNLS